MAESGNGVLYSIGRVAGWAVEVGLVYVILAFPSGRLTQRVDRALVWAAALLVAALYLPTALIAESYPVPSPYSSCTAGCPDNAFFVLGSEPSFVDSFLRPLREVLTVLLFLAVTGRLVQRFRGATRLMQRTLEPVLTVAVARCAVLAIAIVVRQASPESAAVEGLSWAIALAVPVMAAAFFLGLVSRRLYAGKALQDLGKERTREPRARRAPYRAGGGARRPVAAGRLLGARRARALGGCRWPHGAATGARLRAVPHRGARR